MPKDSFPILVINLDRAPTRLQAIASQLDTLSHPWERLPALDGANPADFASIAENYDPAANRRRWRHSLSNGEIACFASHRRAWKTIVERRLAGAIILEDDALLAPNFSAAVTVLQTSLHEWHALKLFVFRPRAIISAKPLKSDAPSEPKFTIGDYLKTPVCTTGYALSADAAEKLLYATNRFFRPVDVQLQRYWETRVQFQALLPYPVLQNPIFDAASTINLGKKQKQKSEKRPFVHLIDQVEFHIQTFGRAIPLLAKNSFQRVKK